MAISTARLADALENLPLGAVLFDPEGNPAWANAATRALVANSAAGGLDRLTAALAESKPIVEATSTRSPSVGEVRLPTDRGLVSREVWAAPSGEWTIATFYTEEDIRLAGVGSREEVMRLEAMLEHTSDIITMLSGDGTILFSNSASGRLTGLAGSSVNGTNAFDLVHPDDRDYAAARFLEAIGTPGVSEPVEVRVRFADDEWHTVEAVINNLLDVPPLNAAVLTIHDVTERKRDAARLEQSEARLRSLVENLTDVIVVLDGNFDVAYISPAIANVIQAPPETNLGMNALNDIHPDDVDKVAEALARIAAAPLGYSEKVELRLESRPDSGEWRWIESVTVNRLDDPAVEGIVCTLRDVTEQKQIEQELRKAYETEREAAERLREVDRLKDEFLSTVSHELRTPLTSISGFAKLLRGGNLEESLQRELLDRTAANAAHLETMVEQLLDFSALQAGKITVTPESVELRPTVDSAVDTLAAHLAGHNVETDVPAGVAVVADRAALGHVLRNLLDNAAKYSAPESTIRIRSTVNGDEIRVDVEDEGEGIPADLHEVVFDRFVRGPDASHAGRRGTGVGLNVVRRYIELMGGRVWVSSAPGEGSTFSFVLPAS